MGVPLHSRLRKVMQRIFYQGVDFFFHIKASREPIDPTQIRSILVVRINYRIGNTLFLTPLIQALEKEMPAAKIDILIGAAFTKPLLSGFENVRTVYDFPRKLLKNPFFLIRYIRQLRSCRYDLVLNPNSGSGSDRLATFLARGRYKLGACKEEGWMPVNRCVDEDDTLVHEALKPLSLLQIFNMDIPRNMHLSISLHPAEREAAKKVLEGLLQERHLASKSFVVALFRDARFSKKIEKKWWSALIKEMQNIDANVLFIDILSPDVAEPLNKDVLFFRERNLRKLGAFLSNLDAFICGDTGPMHLASASGAATIALFKETSPSLYGTLGVKDVSYNIKEIELYELAQNIYRHIQNQAIIA
jgi:heptosyltransferase III